MRRERVNQVITELPKVGISGTCEEPMLGLQEKRAPGSSAEPPREPFPGLGSGASPAGSQQAPPCLRTHLSWSAGDRAAAQAISARAHWGETRRNSALRFPRPPHFRRKSCPPERLRVPRPFPVRLFWHLSLGARVLAPDVALGPILSR